MKTDRSEFFIHLFTNDREAAPPEPGEFFTHVFKQEAVDDTKEKRKTIYS